MAARKKARAKRLPASKIARKAKTKKKPKKKPGIFSTDRLRKDLDEYTRGWKKK